MLPALSILCGALADTPLGLDEVALADIFWLAAHLPPSSVHGSTPGPVPPLRPWPEPQVNRSSFRGGAAGARGSSSASEQGGERDGAPREERAVPILVKPEPEAGRSSPPAGSALGVVVPAGRALLNGATLSRAMRALKRRIPSRIRSELDIQATIRRFSEERLWLAVLRPARTRWLEVALVVDSAPSMGLWAATVRELQRLLETQGAFRDVRLWRLETLGEEPQLFGRTGAIGRQPKELIEPTGRRLILIVSDCVAAAWRGSALPEWLGLWGSHQPMAMIQLLPSRLWPATALGQTLEVMVSGQQAGVPNARLTRRFKRRLRPVEVGGVPVPVFGLEPTAVQSWARCLAGRSDAEVPAFIWDAKIAALSWVEASPTAAVAAEDQVARFVAVASPSAIRLAGLLAAAPLRLPVMRLIQEVMLPDSSQGDLAEVLLSGLIRRKHADRSDTDIDQVDFEFHPGVQEVLLSWLFVSDVIQVRAAVAEYIARNLGIKAEQFSAEIPLARRGLPIEVLGREFARVSATVLGRLGPAFADEARRWAELSGAESEPRATPREPRPVPPRGARASSPPVPEVGAEQEVWNFRAELEDEMVLGTTVPVEVTWSREWMGALEASAANPGGFPSAGPKLSFDLVPRKNLEAAGPTQAEAGLPQPGVSVTVLFQVRATSVGPGVVSVRISQGALQLAHLNLSCRIVTTRSRPPERRSVNVSVPVIQTLPAPWTCLTVLEVEHMGAVRYRFLLQGAELGLHLSCESSPLGGPRGEVVSRVYRQIEKCWLGAGSDPGRFDAELRELGAQLADELLPKELQKALWENRDRLEGLVLWPEEPDLPWEALCLKDPEKPQGAGSLFLGELGMVRWGGTMALPPAILPVRPGRCHYVIPHYPHPADRLPGAEQEAGFLTEYLGASPIAPHLEPVRELLASPGSVDLFYFAGHGTTPADDTAGAGLLLEGRLENGKYIAEVLRASTVEPIASLEAGAVRPIIVLNASVDVQAGPRLSGMGEFARAFLSWGAGVFIGPLWAVGNQSAGFFIQTLYERLKAGDNLAKAASAARQAARRSGDPGWLSYTVYGHPRAQLEWQPDPSNPWSGVRVLWVDDHPENNRRQRRELERRGAQVVPALSTNAGLEALAKERFDVVISDMSRAEGVRAGLDLLDQMRIGGMTQPFAVYAARQGPLWRAQALAHLAQVSTNVFSEVVAALETALRKSGGISGCLAEERLSAVRDTAEKHGADSAVVAALNQEPSSPDGWAKLWTGREPGSAVQLAVHLASAATGCGYVQVFRFEHRRRLFLLAQDIAPGKANYWTASLQGLIGRAARSGETIWAPFVQEETDYIAAEPSTQSELAIPIRSPQLQDVVAVLNLESPLPNAFGPLQIRWLEQLARSLAPLIEAPAEGIPVSEALSPGDEASQGTAQATAKLKPESAGESALPGSLGERAMGAGESTQPAGWLLQANPEQWPLQEKLKAGETVRWSVSRYTEKIRPGMLVLLWQAKGHVFAGAITKALKGLLLKGKGNRAEHTRGLWGWGITTEEAHDGGVRFVCIERWESGLSPEAAPLPAAEVLRLASWTRHLIARNPQGGIFLLEAEQLREVAELVAWRIGSSQLASAVEMVRHHEPLSPSLFVPKTVPRGENPDPAPPPTEIPPAA